MPPRILIRTAETAFCRKCEGEGGRARWNARWYASLAPMREWLMAAPLFSDQLLDEACSQFDPYAPVAPKTEQSYRWGPTGVFAPWVDTLDLDKAASWLDSVTDGRPGNWPPAGREACRRLADALFHEGFRPDTVVDVSAVFGSPGLPYPPVPDVPRDDRPIWSTYLKAGLVHLEGTSTLPNGRTRPHMGAAGLPAGYNEVLALEMMIVRGLGYHAPDSVDLDAIGSVFRDADGRVKVLWQNRDRRSPGANRI